MWWARSRVLSYSISFVTGNLMTKRFRGVSRPPRTPICGRRSGDYSTEVRAGTKAAASLVKTLCQAWLKLTTHGAFVTITDSLETEFPG